MSLFFSDGLPFAQRERGLIPVIAAVAAITSLALGGWDAARSLSRVWHTETAQQVTIEIPDPVGEANTIARRLITVLRDDPGVASVVILSEPELRAVLRPWLETAQASLNELPVVLFMTRKTDATPTDLSAILDTLAPSAIIQENAAWSSRLTDLGRSLETCSGFALLLSGFAMAGIITFSIHMTLISKRHVIEILHHHGALDGLIARSIAWRSAGFGLSGGAIGTGLGVLTLAMLRQLVQPFLNHQNTHLSLWPQNVAAWVSVMTAFPASLLECLVFVPLLAAGLSFAVAHSTVLLWLRRLP